MKRKIGVCGVVALVTGIMGTLAMPVFFSTTAIITGAVAVAKKQKFGWAGLIIGSIGWMYGLIMFYVALNDFQIAMANLGI